MWLLGPGKGIGGGPAMGALPSSPGSRQDHPSPRPAVQLLLDVPETGAEFNSSVASLSAERCSSEESNFLEEMRLRCVSVQPRVQVQIARVDMEGGSDKAATILFQCNMRGVDLLVIGQRRSSTSSFLSRKLSGTSYDLAECLIEKSRCQCIGVQKKGENADQISLETLGEGTVRSPCMKCLMPGPS